ncbi:MAG: hypothetical protein SFU25_05100 [Candidatus Caenarcaniphilales bacterium]|nr:hypothetical protein [Candidatus Caenarcaniphilales bacterium]
MFKKKEILKLASFLIICNLLVQSSLQANAADTNNQQVNKPQASHKSGQSSQKQRKTPEQNSKQASKPSFPGIYISDTENRWHISDYKYEEGEQFGYVICKGGYIGSPLIPNDKASVDKFLGYCKRGERVGPGKLPVIDVPSNYETDERSYKAYHLHLNGQNFFLCRGYLNSTPTCSYEGDKKAMALMSKIKKGLPVGPSESGPPIQEYREQPQQYIGQKRLESEVIHLEKREIGKRRLEPVNVDPTKQALSDEIAREILSTLSPSSRAIDLSGAKKIKLEAVPLSAMKAESGENLAPRSLQISAEEFEALKSGRITLADLTENRGNLNSLLPSLIATQEPTKKAIQITPAELEALQNGRISLEQLASGKQLVEVNASGQVQSLPAETTQKKGLQITAAEAEDLKAGRVTLEQLMSTRSLVDLNNSGISSGQAMPLALGTLGGSSPGVPNIPPTVNGMSTAGATVVPITPETLAALQSGSVNINQVVQGTGIAGQNPMQAPPMLANAGMPPMQVPPKFQGTQGVMAQQMPPGMVDPMNGAQPLANVVGAPQNFQPMQQGIQDPSMMSPQMQMAQQTWQQPFPQQMQPPMQQPAQQIDSQMLAQTGQSNPNLMPNPMMGMQQANFMPNQMPGQMPLQGQPMMNDPNAQFSAQSPQQGYGPEGLQINAPQGGVPDWGNISYQDYYEQPTQQGTSVQPLAWSGYYFNQRFYGPPMTYSTNAIYGTHSNTMYWPGMRSNF